MVLAFKALLCPSTKNPWKYRDFVKEHFRQRNFKFVTYLIRKAANKII